MRKHTLIGTAGHVDHGKTTLIQALTGIDTDRLKEEKKRGITIDLGYAYLALPDGGMASIIDVPGHEKFIKNMLAGAGGIDLVLLVIAADDGVMPQTREHLAILQLLGAEDGIIVLTKRDIADDEWCALVREDIREAVAGTFLADAPIIEVSAHTGLGMDALKNLIYEKIPAENPAHAAEAPLAGTSFRIPVDRVFSVDGFGTVVTGTLTEGVLRPGDAVTVYPAGRAAKVRYIQVHGGDAEAAFAGQRVAANLSGLRREDITRGDVLAPPDTLRPTRMLDVKLTVLADSPREIKNGSRLHFYYGTHNALCKAVLLGCDSALPGRETFAQLRFTEDIAVKQGDRFVVRFYSPVETVGGGMVLHTNPKKHRRAKAAEISQSLEMREQSAADPAALVLQAIADESPRFTPLADIKKQLGYPEFDAILADLSQANRIIMLDAHHAIDENFRAYIAARMAKTLAAYHKENPLQPGMRKEELRSRVLPDIKSALFDALLQVCARGEIHLQSGRASLAGFSVSYTPELQAIRDDIINRMKKGGFSPPAPDELTETGKQKKALAARQIIDALLTEGTLIAAEPGIIFTAEAVEEAKAAFASLPAPASLAQFRDALGTSRKFALALLEYFDRIGFTRKEGEGRVLLLRKPKNEI